MPAICDRYLCGLPRGSRRVFLSWRLLSTGAPDTPFHIARQVGGKWVRVTAAPLLTTTNCLYTSPDGSVGAYRVVGGDGLPSETVEVDADAPPSILALDQPFDPEARIHGVARGDLCNNGRMGYVLRAARRGRVWLLAFRHDGRLLWELDTGLPASGGWDDSTLNVPFLCWHVNGDGRTEVVVHRSGGAAAGDRYEAGLPGELLSALDAETGQTVWDAQWPAVRSRVMMTVGHLRGLDQPAQVVVQDETYGDVVLTAVDGERGTAWWRVEQARPAGHNLDIADIDGCGCQEVICGGVCYSGDGRLRWEAEPFGHTDISKPARIVPDREGLQIWFAVESHNPGVYLVDHNGTTLFRESFRHAHYGWVARHAPGVPGLHPHTAEDARHEYGAAGTGIRDEGIFLPDGTHWLNLTDWQRKNFVPVHWDERPEVVFIIGKKNKRLVRLKPDGTTEDLPEGKLPEGGVYGRNLLCADVIGDFRENIVTVDEGRNHLIVLANPTVAGCRGYSPCDHFEYRHDRSQHGSGYYIYLSPPDTRV